MAAVKTAVRRPLRLLAARLGALASLAVVLGCGWLATMELFLRHDGYGWRFMVEAAIVAQSALTIAVLEDLMEATAALRWPLTAGAAADAALGWWIIAEDLARPGLPARPHFEGYLLIIGLALIAYGLMTIVAMLTIARAPSPRL
jgi:ABC-type uncharacterized transport system permease subunit